jgi:hypothetical protein
MAQYSKTVPKNPVNADDTLKAVMEVIIFQTEDGDDFIKYEIKPDKVLLTFDGED